MSIIDNDVFARELGIAIIAAKNGAATVELTVTPRHCNALGICHGAVLFAVGDLALAAAANSRGRLAVSLNATINWVANVKSGATLTAQAQEISLTNKTAVYEVKIRDGENKILAALQGTCYRKTDNPLVSLTQFTP